jgi:GT2 family glycosyltransferase
MSKPTHEFSIIVPTHNRPTQLGECLDALAKLEYPRDRFGIVVVDDGSAASLEPVVAPYRAAIDARLLRQTNAGPAAARNAGAAQARGRFIAFTDDDCRPRPDWLDRLREALEVNPRALVGGPSVNVLTRNAYCTASQVILDVVYTFFNGGPDGPRFFASNNFAMARQRFHELGGFDVNFHLAACEDRDLCDRWRHHGLPLVYAPEAIVDHAHPLTLGKFYRQHYNYGRGAFIYHQLRKKRQSGRMRDDMGLHFRMPALLREPMSKLSWSMAARVLALLSVWHFANAHGFFVEKCQVRKKPHLPAASG